MPADPARVAELFDEAVELADGEASAFLTARCGDDTSLRAAVQSLLDHHRALTPEFLATLPVLVTRREVAGPPGPVLPAPLREGARIGRLQILRELGRGAMGSVYAAYDEVLDRKVAVKRLHGAAIDEAGRRAAILREARALARLSHPHIVQIYEVVEDGPEILLAMEFVPGRSLRAWSADAHDWRTVLDVLVQAGRGLAAAHAVGVTHGDVKPDNVLVGDDGRVRVVDFGLASWTAPGSTDAPLSTRIAGTPAYMAPEQFLGRASDPASDQFSYCATLYTCLFGQLPFAADSVVALIASHDVPPRPPAVPGLPAELPTIVLRGLAPDRAARWPDMDALLAALARVLASDPEADLALARRQRWTVALVLLVVGSALTVYLFVLRSAVDLQPRDLAIAMGVIFAALAAMLAALWRQIGRNRVNRQFAGIVLAAVAAMLVHRLIGVRLDSPVSHTMIGDLLLQALAAVAAALTCHPRFAWLAGVLVVVAVVATFAPSHAPALFVASVLLTYGLAVVVWRRG